MSCYWRDWYDEDPRREKTFREIVSGDYGFSLREIDHFVTNMAARKPIVFVNARDGSVVDVNSDYKDMLRCYHKVAFDPFRRNGGEDKQRNFFKWAMETGVVDYVARHSQEIAHDLISHKSHQQLKTTTTTYVAIIR